jgi:hypothetical protein
MRQRDLCESVLIVISTVLLLASSQDGFGQSPESKQTAASSEYVILSEAKLERVHQTARKFYKTRDLPRFQARGAVVGHISRGVITSEELDKSELDLDVNPCDSVMEVFHKPYRKVALSKTITCAGKHLTYYEVEQQK